MHTIAYLFLALAIVAIPSESWTLAIVSLIIALLVWFVARPTGADRLGGGR
jgi:NhaP-type Na+/H+ and K+/H+ antiporter